MDDDGLDPATRTCDLCLHPLEPAGSERHPYWSCPFCGAVSIAA